MRSLVQAKRPSCAWKKKGAASDWFISSTRVRGYSSAGRAKQNYICYTANFTRGLHINNSLGQEYRKICPRCTSCQDIFISQKCPTNARVPYLKMRGLQGAYLQAPVFLGFLLAGIFLSHSILFLKKKKN